MKRKISYIVVLLLGVMATTFNSCEEKDDYNYDNIEPAIFSIAGNVNPMQGRHYLYSTAMRGGSTFAWSTALNGEVVSPGADVEASKTLVYFPDVIAADATTKEQVIVAETTLGGKTSEPFALTIASVVPFAPLPISGPTIVNGSFSSTFNVSPSVYDKTYNTYTWEATAGEITVDASAPWQMSIYFANEDAGVVTISLTEDNGQGFVETSTFEVEVNAYCPLPNWLDDLVGTWSGEDAWYESVVSTEVDGENIAISGLSVGFIEDWWAETVTLGGTATMVVNEDGTLDIARQYIYTTDYNGDPYDYEIEGAGRWNNCGDYPVLTIIYDIYYPGDELGLAATYSPAYLPTPYMTALITLDPAKLPSNSILLKKPTK